MTTPIDFELIARDTAQPTFARIREAAKRCEQATKPRTTSETGPMASDVTLNLKLDTSQFDRQIRRVRRQAKVAHIWGHLWLAAYAAVMTGIALTLTIVEITR